MAVVRANLTISADGFLAGPNQSVDHPLGEGADSLHDWAFKLKPFNEMHGREGGETNESSVVAKEMLSGVGATVMGRNMFGGGPGPWPDDPWTGWWGDNPPFHHPVFVVTHFDREPLEMEGGTTFYFVTDGVESAVEQARDAAGDADVAVGGAAIFQQSLQAKLLEELWLTTVPLLLGSGERLLDGAFDAGAKFEQVQSVAGPDAVHAKYRVSY